MRGFEITKREIIASISILAAFLLIGVLIAGKINDYILDRNEVYNKAIKIHDDEEIFKYCLDTNIGNALVYGDLKAIEPVTYPEISGEYMSLKKVKERYTMHTRRVKRGENYVTETYWTWDEVGRWSQHCDKVKFLGVIFDFEQIYSPYNSYLDTQYESSKIRYVYYGSPVEYKGTLFTSIKNNTVNDSTFYNNDTIEEVIDHMDSNILLISFWIVWILLIIVCIYRFYYLDNDWLNKGK